MNRFKTLSRALLLLTALSAILFVATSFAQEKEEPKSYDATCFVKKRAEFGLKCGKPESLVVELENTCDEAMDVFCLIKRKNGKWYSNTVYNVKPGETTGDKFFVCDAAGNFTWYARKFGSTTRFPSKKDVEAMEGKD